jgi:hypothetical protein
MCRGFASGAEIVQCDGNDDAKLRMKTSRSSHRCNERHHQRDDQDPPMKPGSE